MNTTQISFYFQNVSLKVFLHHIIEKIPLMTEPFLDQTILKVTTIMTTKWPAFDLSFFDQTLILGSSVSMTTALTTFQYGFTIGGLGLETLLQFFLIKKKWVGSFGHHTVPILILT